MSISSKVVKILTNEALGVVFEEGRYSPNPSPIHGKFIFAGGMGVAYEDKPRNIMGGTIIRSEVFKIVLKGANYIELEHALIKASDALKHAGYIQASGFEHIETADDAFLQLAITFKSLK